MSHAQITQLPPQAVEIEEAVLGIALCNADALRTMLRVLTNKDIFYKPANQLSYLAMQALADQGEAVDINTVTQHLKAHGTLQRAGGPHSIAKLANNAGSPANLETHCRILQQQYMKRLVIQCGIEMQTKGHDESRDALELLADAQAQLSAHQRSLETRPSQTAAGIFEAAFNRILWAVENHGMTGVPTGITELDKLTGGWQPSDLILLAARPSIGKTAAMLHFARMAVLEHRMNTIIFSLEMPNIQLMMRLIASEVQGYSNSDLRRGNIPGGSYEVTHIRQQAARLNTGQLHLDDTPGLTLQQLRAKCMRVHTETPLQLVLVDYVQLMSGTDKRINREQEISRISRGLKELAKELDVPVIALAQLSRDVEKRPGEKRAMLSDLRESGSLEQDADAVVFLWRGEVYGITEYSDGSSTADTILFDLAKHRNGATGQVVASYDKRRGIFKDFAEDAQ
jgi:replicative DNA helicase